MSYFRITHNPNEIELSFYTTREVAMGNQALADQRQGRIDEPLAQFFLYELQIRFVNCIDIRRTTKRTIDG
jgi:hypothetical protein